MMKLLGRRRLSTEACNSFIEQVDSMSASASFIILATCETPNSFLPHRISQFFTCNVSNFTGPSPPEHTIPRFLMQLDGKFNRELVFDLSAENIARDLIKQYVQLVHCRTHVADKFKIRETMKVNSEGKTLEMDSGTANGVTDGSSVLKSGGTLDEEVGTQPHQDSVARIPPKRNAKGKSNLLYSIATFGYQILRYPHFAELCWATSKLKDGPCTGVNGPWKAWPFNSCFIFPNNLMEKKAIGGRNRENSVVRGLVAVGLLAYKGFYTSVREVSLEVRRVLELFVEHINIKILGGKDRYQFLRLLSQVAYLEDMVNSWAYSLQSLELECQVSSSNWRPTNVGRLDSIDNHAYSGGAVKNDEILPTISDDNKKEVISLVSEENLVRVSPEKGESGKSNKEDAHLGLNNLDEAILSPKVDGVISGLQVDAFQDMVSLSPTSNALFKNGGNGNANKEASCPDMSASGRGVLGPGIEIYPEMVPVAFSCPPLLQKLELASGSFCIEHPPCSSENHGSHNGGLGSPILSNGSVVVESKVNCHSVRNIVSPLEENGCNANKPIGDSNTNFTPENNDTSISETLCVYSCCCECMHKIRGLVREIISGNWESNGCGSTVEDVHDVVETCSVSLLATIKKSFVSKSCTNSGDLGGTRDKHCCCQKVGDTHLKKISLSEGSENIGVMPMECICHSSTRNSRSDGPRLRFFYRDCRLVSSDPDKGASFHCKFESLCACATIEKILMIREPLD